MHTKLLETGEMSDCSLWYQSKHSGDKTQKTRRHSVQRTSQPCHTETYTTSLQAGACTQV